MAHMRELAGFASGRFAEGDHVVAVGMNLWRDYEALRMFYGDEIDRPLLIDPYGEWVNSAKVERYEHAFTLATTEVSMPDSAG